MTNEVVRRNEPVEVTPLAMLDRAIKKGISADQLDKLLDLQQRWEADQARKAFVHAMAAFKAEPLRVGKGKHVSFRNKSGGITEYDHATLAQVVDAVVGGLSRHGLSHRWETNQDGHAITVSCIITHELGHSERATLSAGADESGGKNSIQAVGSTVTYLERYTLMSVTGLAAHDMDDDGRGATKKADEPALITQEQANTIRRLLEETGSDPALFLAWANVERVEDISAKHFDTVKARIESKAKK